MKTDPASIHILHTDPTMEIGLHAILSAQSVWTVRRGKLDVQDFSTVALFVTDYSTGLRLARADGSGVPVLVVTQRDKEWEVRTALECGVRGYLLQSCEPSEVMCAARVLMEGQHYLSTVLSQRVADSLGRAALTRREYEVLQLLAEGYCNKLIARRLGIEVGTVKTHVKGLMSKLDASARTHAVMIAAERGLVTAGQRLPQATTADAILCQLQDMR
jgi:DNA-binding NarL/FixJ family response regulator